MTNVSVSLIVFIIAIVVFVVAAFVTNALLLPLSFFLLLSAVYLK